MTTPNSYKAAYKSGKIPEEIAIGCLLSMNTRYRRCGRQIRRYRGNNLPFASQITTNYKGYMKKYDHFESFFRRQLNITNQNAVATMDFSLDPLVSAQFSKKVADGLMNGTCKIVPITPPIQTLQGGH